MTKPTIIPINEMVVAEEKKILDETETKLEALILQATKERTHYYVKSVAEDALKTIKYLRTSRAMAIRIATRLKQ